MKQKAYTKTQVKRLIREIAKVTQSSDELSGHFAALLSAMRGPDSDFDGVTKNYTTGVIRSRLGWYCGLMGRAGVKLDEVLTKVNKAQSEHFRQHICQAVDALEYFGYGDTQTKGGKKA
jgi:hypothetical protein